MNKTPAVRFKGFTKDWEQRKLGDITVSYSGGTPTAGNTEYYGGAIPFIRSGEISKKQTELFITESGLKNSSAAMVNKGDILYALYGATSGEVSISKMKGAINQAILAILPNKEYDSNFLMQWLRIKKDYIIATYLQGGQGNLSGTIVKNLIVDLPSFVEQTRIGSTLTYIDNLITLHQRKYEKLVNIKKSMLYKMFPQNGRKTPEIRFKGFTDDWEQRKLGEMGTTFTGLSGKSKEDFGHGDARFVTYMNVFTNPVSDPARVEAVEIDKRQNAVQYGDVFFTTSSETPEEVGMSSVWLKKTENTYLNSFCFGYRPTDTIDHHYMAYMLRSETVRKRIIYLAQGISRYNISKNGVMQIEVPLPDLEEQKLIGEYFINLDNLITLHQHKLEKLKNLKQAMLHKMFV